MSDLLDALKVAIALALMSAGLLCGLWGVLLLMAWLQKAMGL
jgi:hypothetical protein